MVKKRHIGWSAMALVAAAGCALAQPTILTLGDGVSISGVSNDGMNAIGMNGSSMVKWTFGQPLSIFTLPTGASGLANTSDDCLFATAVVPNTDGLGGLSTTATLAARWSEATNVWSNLGLLSPNANLGVTGSSAQSGSISTPRDISATGRFVVGQGYIAPGSFRFRGWVWDSQALGGLGEQIVLPTSFDANANRYRDGRALAVSDDGSVIVGGENPNTSSGRVIVYRYNTGTSSYDWSYLPDDAPGRNVDSFHINAAGTVIVGSSFAPNGGGQLEAWLTKWTWNADTQVWDRTLLYNTSTGGDISSWWDLPDCPIPPDFTPTAISDDGNTIVGILRYSTCGSFVRSGFIFTGGQMWDMYDYLVAQGADMSYFASTGTNLPPRMGFATDVSADGRYVVGAGTFVQSSGGPGYIIDLQGQGGCVAPFVTTNPSNIAYSRCSTFILNAGAGGTAPLTFQWFKDGQPIADGAQPQGSNVTGATTNRLVVTGLTLSEVGNYHCRITGVCGEPVETSVAIASLDPAVPAAANDTCATAIAVTEGTNVLNPAQGICGAWVDESGPSCATTSPFDLWYSWTPTFTGEARIETCGANYDTALSVYDTCNGLELACNNDRDTGGTTGCSSNRSRIGRIAVTQGVPLLIRVGAPGFTSTSSTLNLSIFPAPAIPANDECANATPIDAGTHAFDLTEATGLTQFPVCGPTTGSIRDLWYVLSPSCDGIYRVDTCGSGISNPILTIYDVCSGTELFCNDNVGTGVTGCTSQQARISDLALKSSQTLLLRVGVSGNSVPSNMVGQINFVRTGCNPDLNEDGSPDQGDLAYIIGVVAGGENPSGINADFNCDGSADQGDIATIIDVIAGGACP